MGYWCVVLYPDYVVRDLPTLGSEVMELLARSRALEVTMSFV